MSRPRSRPATRARKVSKPKKSTAARAKPTQIPTRSNARAAEITRILEDQKATDIRKIQLANHVTDLFVIATATGVRHLHSLAENLLEQMAQAGFRAHHIEGHGAGAPSDRWVLVDFLDVVVHLFTEEGRAFYALDRILDEEPAGT